MNIREYSQKIGLQEPVRVFLMGDNHLSYADAREGERERAHAKVRNIDFFSCGQGESYLQKTYEGLLGACRDDGDLLVMVGDVIDHPSARNRELLAVAAGMHPVMVPDMLAPDDEMAQKAEAVLDDLTAVWEYISGCDNTINRNATN